MEVLAAIVLLTVGVIALSNAMAGLARAENVMVDSDKVNRLAKQKLDELVASGDFSTTSGSFDQPSDNFDWTLTQSDTGVTDLTGYSVKVKDHTGNVAREGYAETLVYLSTQTTTGAATQ